MKTMVMIPTFNESENIDRLINDILALKDDSISIVVVDDNSPDGTSQIVAKMAKGNPKIHLITRTEEKGRGTAGIRGFQYAIEQKADYILEMDSDYSHHPRYIPAIIDKMKDNDVSIGSRGIKGGRETGRGIGRILITKFANFYIKLIMGMNIKDCTSGYRCFKREVLESIALDKMVSTGPSIVEEILYACHKKGYKMTEVPIVFEDRTEGESTKNIQQYLDTAWKIFMFRCQG